MIGAILFATAHGNGMPAVVHGSSGKDRTGLVSAVLLLAVGVGERDVLDDYGLTAQYSAAHRAESLIAKMTAAGLPAALAAGLLGASRAAMAEVLALLRDGLGGIESSLLNMVGLTRDDLRGLRLRMTTT